MATEAWSEERDRDLPQGRAGALHTGCVWEPEVLMFSSEEGLVLKSFSSSVESVIQGGIGTETSGVRTADLS